MFAAHHPPKFRHRTVAAVGLLFVVSVCALAGASGAEGTHGDLGAARTASVEQDWSWPLVGPRSITNPYRAPAHTYGAGHRGIDIVDATGSGVMSPRVLAPAPGVVAFVGTVVDRPLVTIDHGDGIVTTFEPVTSNLLPGATVEAGSLLGTVSVGGHASVGNLHVGARRDGVYINPLALFGGIPRAVLLPCCEPLAEPSG